MNFHNLVIIFLIISFATSHRHHNTKEKFTKILGKVRPDPNSCNEKICPPDRGTCSGDNICYCFNGYLTEFSSEAEGQCNYQQKDRLLFFLLEFICSFGIGHLYVGRYYFGFAKMAFITILISVYFIAFNKKKGIDAARVRVFIMTLFTIWQCIDGYCIWTGKYKDGNNKPTGFLYF